MIFPIGKAKHRILDCIYREKKIKISDLLKKARVSQKTGYRYIEEFLDAGVISEELKGKKPVLRFLRPNFKTEAGLLCFCLLEVEKRNEFFRTNKKLKAPFKQFVDDMRDIAETALIFGSFARGGQSKDSDIDVAVLADLGKRERIERDVERRLITLENRASVRIFDPDKFFKSDDSLVLGMMEEHIILFGFWEWINRYKCLYI